MKASEEQEGNPAVPFPKAMDRLRGCTRKKPNLLHSFLPPNTLKFALLADIIWVCSVLLN